MNQTQVLPLPLLIGVLLLISPFAFSQLMTNSNVGITINASTQLTVKGDVQNVGTSTITNSGTIDLNGNWINNSTNNCFGISQGTVIFNGANQTIGGSSSTLFNHLTLAGTGIKTLLVNTTAGGGNVAPTGVLALGALPLQLNSKSLTITNPTPLAITRTTGLIESESVPALGYGVVQWNIGTAAAGNNFIIPFGIVSPAAYIPLNINITTAGAGATGFISAATYPTNVTATPNNRPLPTGVPSLNDISGTENASKVIDRYWIMGAQNYSTLPVSTLLFRYRESEWDATGGSTNLITETELRAQKYDGFVWSNPTLGSVSTALNTVTVTNVNAYNNLWTLVANSSPLPNELLSFTATPAGTQHVLCQWVTASEQNNDFFTVERSVDGLNFEKVGIVDGAGNSNGYLNYTFTDQEPYKGVSYYRLKQTDFDGRFSYSEIVAVNFSGLSFMIYPNPATGNLFLVCHATSKQEIRIKMIDVCGRLIKQRTETAEEGENLYQMDLGNCAKGMYQMIILQKNNSTMLKVLVK